MAQEPTQTDIETYTDRQRHTDRQTSTHTHTDREQLESTDNHCTAVVADSSLNTVFTDRGYSTYTVWSQVPAAVLANET